jgi:hypothetical protein
MYKYFLSIILFGTFGIMNDNNINSFKNNLPERGCVPDASTAFKIAEAILIPIYGKDVIEQERPFVSELQDSIWIVCGTNKESKGGVFHIEIQKKDCKVLKIYHGK